jgi:Collagen triple helix repeat (20 copies)
MTIKFLYRAAGVAAVAVGASALAGLPLADANPQRAHIADNSGKSLLQCIRFDVDDQQVCGILRRGQQGRRGAVGPQGRTGPIGPAGVPGPLGPVGPQGVQGIKGDTGAVGPTGATGPQGIQGSPGPPVVAVGSVVRFTYAQGAPNPQGKPLAPSTAACPVGPTPHVYGGGVIVTPSNASGGDVVTAQSSFPGAYNNGSVTPVANGATATGWEVDAVVTTMSVGDSVTVQAYAVCGP